jgi:hypothetical protein
MATKEKSSLALYWFDWRRSAWVMPWEIRAPVVRRFIMAGYLDGFPPRSWLTGVGAIEIGSGLRSWESFALSAPLSQLSLVVLRGLGIRTSGM